MFCPRLCFFLIFGLLNLINEVLLTEKFNFWKKLARRRYWCDAVTRPLLEPMQMFIVSGNKIGSVQSDFHYFFRPSDARWEGLWVGILSNPPTHTLVLFLSHSVSHTEEEKRWNESRRTKK